jgi:hypothetical protein
MAVDQLPGRLREFVAYLDGVLARLDQGAGWCAVFWQRDPDGMQACLDGREVPPWDVVEALLQDLAAEYGPEVAHAEAERARPLHAAAQAAHDARPGGRDALGDRFDIMLREQRYAAERQAELGRRLAAATTLEEADALRLDLAWARDDHERAVRRCAELQSRMAELDHRTMRDQARAIRRGQVGDGGQGLGGYGGEAAEGGGQAAGGSQVGGRGPGGGYGNGPVGGGEHAAGTTGGGRRADGYGGDAVGGGGRAAGRYEDAATGGGGHESAMHGHGGHEAGARGADGRGGGFPDMPQQRDATSAGATAAEAPHPGHAPQWPNPTGGAARPGSAPHPTAPAWADASEGAPRRFGAGDAAGPTHPTAPAWADAPGDVRPRPAAAEAARPGYTPYPTARAESDGPGPAPQRSDPAEAAHPGYATPTADPTRSGRHQYRPSEGPYAQAPAPYTRPDRTSAPDIDSPQQPTPSAPPPEATTSKRKRRRGGARFAGMSEQGDAAVVVPPAAVPQLPTAPVAKGRSPRGARFAGAAEVPEVGEQQAEPLDVVARRETAETVATLLRLRSEGRTGEAHAVLVDVAHWPADRFPLLAAELQRAGLGADWASLLWEAASLPAERLVAAADALVAAGRSTDGEQVLRQGVARPAGEIGTAVLALVAEGRRREVTALLDAYVRVRTPEEAARSAEPGPATLVPLLLAAARGVSDERHWDLVHALRVAGFSA